jgi:hypothetical protein
VSHAHLTINDEVKIDGDFDELIVRPPAFWADIVAKMQPHSAQKPEAHLIAAAGVIGEAMLRKVNITVDMTVGPDWFSMMVKER